MEICRLSMKMCCMWKKKKLHSMCSSTEWSMSASESVEKNQSMRVVKERCVGGVAVKSTRSMESAKMKVRMEIRPRDTEATEVAPLTITD